MVKKTIKFDPENIKKLPNDKPVVYKIQNGEGENIYTGIAKRGRVRNRPCEHLEGTREAVPGAKVQIEQMSSINDAKEKEQRIINRSKPKFNKK